MLSEANIEFMVLTASSLPRESPSQQKGKFIKTLSFNSSCSFILFWMIRKTAHTYANVQLKSLPALHNLTPTWLEWADTNDALLREMRAENKEINSEETWQRGKGVQALLASQCAAQTPYACTQWFSASAWLVSYKSTYRRVVFLLLPQQSTNEYIYTALPHILFPFRVTWKSLVPVLYFIGAINGLSLTSLCFLRLSYYWQTAKKSKIFCSKMSENLKLQLYLWLLQITDTEDSFHKFLTSIVYISTIRHIFKSIFVPCPLYTSILVKELLL